MGALEYITQLMELYFIWKVKDDVIKAHENGNRVIVFVLITPDEFVIHMDKSRPLDVGDKFQADVNNAWNAYDIKKEVPLIYTHSDPSPFYKIKILETGW